MSERFDEIWAILKENAKGMQELKKRQEKTDEQLAQLTKQQEERNAAWEKQMQESNAAWEKEMKEERRLRKESNKKLESYITVESDIQEDAYYRTGQREIEEKGFIMLGGIAYDSVDKNVKGRFEKVVGQYDVVFYNRSHIFIVEVKHKLRLDDFDQVFRHKETFPVVFPRYQDFQIHLGLACQSIPEHFISHAKAKGVYLLQPEADQIKIIEP